jgi:hypothetical protein
VLLAVELLVLRLLNRLPDGGFDVYGPFFVTVTSSTATAAHHLAHRSSLNMGGDVLGADA